MADQRFLKEHHLRRPADFKRVYRRRRSVADPILVVYACENDMDRPRLGLSVSRRVGNAVVRNRWKRLIREAFRRTRTELPCGVDFVVIPRAAARPTMQTVLPSLRKLATQAAAKLNRPSNASKRPSR